MRKTGVAKTGQVFARRGIGWKESLLQCSLLVAVILLAGVGGSPVQPDSGLGRWLERQIPEVGDQNDQLIPIEVNEDQGENEYSDAVLLREGQVEPKKKPIQPRFSFYDGLRNRRRMPSSSSLSDEEKLFAKRDLNGMSMSITHNLDILRRGLLRELSLRQREQDRRHLMENNKKFLNGIGKRRRR